MAATATASPTTTATTTTAATIAAMTTSNTSNTVVGEAVYTIVDILASLYELAGDDDFDYSDEEIEGQEEEEESL